MKVGQVISAKEVKVAVIFSKLPRLQSFKTK